MASVTPFICRARVLRPRPRELEAGVGSEVRGRKKELTPSKQYKEIMARIAMLGRLILDFNWRSLGGLCRTEHDSTSESL